MLAVPDTNKLVPADSLSTQARENLERAVNSGMKFAGIDEARATLDAGPLDAIQNSYSLLARGDEAEVLPLCVREGVSYTVYSPLAGGWLTGKYRRGSDFPAGSRMTQRPDPYADFLRDEVYDALERLEALADARAISMAGLSLSWLLSNPDVCAVVVGPGSPAQLEPVREALANPLERAEREAIAGVFS